MVKLAARRREGHAHVFCAILLCFARLAFRAKALVLGSWELRVTELINRQGLLGNLRDRGQAGPAPPPPTQEIRIPRFKVKCSVMAADPGRCTIHSGPPGQAAGHSGPWPAAGPLLARCWPAAGPLWPAAGPLLAHCGPLLARCWPIVARCWPIVARCWPIVARCLARCLACCLAREPAVFGAPPRD
eukprot:gene6490-biopygen10426